jgi:hypothetical protein
MKPIRIQRKRTKGFRMPPNTIYVGRPSRWANAWKIGSNIYDPATNTFRKCETAADVVLAFRRCVDWDPAAKSVLPTFDENGKRAGYLEVWGGYSDEIHVNQSSIKKYLRSKNLACWCALDQPCHADVLLEIANEQKAESA